VVPPIVALEAVPVLADVGADLNLTADIVGAAMTRKTKAIIVPHLFGNPADIGSIVELAHAKNIRVIDDAAQALGATFGGRPLGSFGDAGIVSFGKEKICFGLGGGALVTKRSPVLVDSPQRLASAEIAPVLKQLAATQFAWRWRRWTLPIQKLIERDVDDGPATPPAPYRPEAMGNLQAAVALNLMRSLDENLAARRARVNRYREMLGDEPGLELLPHRTGSACLTQVVRIRPQRRDQDSTAVLIATVRSRGYEVQGSYVPIHLLACFKQCVWDALPQTERIWADLIELPCEPSVSLSEVERISSLVKSFCRSDTATRRVKARPLSRLRRMDCAN
jgi:dTDP-4-amino-4,6-dideoxygalactose transaminase